MKLTEEQLVTVRRYIFITPSYRETYNELYDHILNALENMDGPFNLALLEQIITDDFGGFEKIAAQEKLYQKQVTGKYKRLLGKEILNTFKFPAILANFCIAFLCIAIYIGSVNLQINIKPMFRTLYFIATVPLLFYFYKRFIADGKHIKPSIKYDFLHQTWIFGFLFMQTLYLLTGSQGLFKFSLHIQFIIASCLFFVASIYIRAFMKVYYKKISVLAV